MEFKKYQHIERFGTTEVKDVSDGTCYVFPKIDGTNASIWLGDDGVIQAGSRNRTLELGKKDNAGFYDWVLQQENLVEYFEKWPTSRLFGEWLVPHSLKTYRDDAWRKFYVFDACSNSYDGSDGVDYIPYKDYQPVLEEFDIDYIPPICVIVKGTYQMFVDCLPLNNFLIKDGEGAGEGIVIKNYDYQNKYGRTTWAKIVTSEFKEKNHKEMGAPLKVGGTLVEELIANKYVTKGRCEKIKAKIENEGEGFRSKDIPRLLNTVYYDIVNEESWEIVKEFKKPTINYRTLQHFVFNKTKEFNPELF